MRKIILYALICILVISCNKGNDGKTGVIIKGNIPAGGAAKNQLSKSGKSLSLGDAKKVMYFNGLDDEGTLLNTKLVDIVNGSFSVSSYLGSVAALVFLDADNQYIGTLSNRGLNVLPLGKLNGGENTTIDLSSLTLLGNDVLPSYDPFGKEIIISDTEIEMLKELDGFFESLAKNIDANNDGKLDIIDNKQIYIRTQFQLRAGMYGLNGVPAEISDHSLDYVNHTFFVFGGKGFISPETISLSGPAEAPYNDIIMQFFTNDLHGCGFGSGFWRETFIPEALPVGSVLLPFKSGTYSVVLDGDPYTMTYSTIDLTYNLLYVLPTLHTNSSGKLTSINFEYILPDKTIVDNPENILNGIGFQLTGENLNYTGPNLSIKPADKLGSGSEHGIYSYTFPTPLDISALHHVTISYTDVLGNIYMFLYQDGL